MWPLKVVDQQICVLEVLREVPPDHRAVGEEEEGDLGPLRLQRFCHVSQICADLYLQLQNIIEKYFQEKYYRTRNTDSLKNNSLKTDSPKNDSLTDISIIAPLRSIRKTTEKIRRKVPVVRDSEIIHWWAVFIVSVWPSFILIFPLHVDRCSPDQCSLACRTDDPALLTCWPRSGWWAPWSGWRAAAASGSGAAASLGRWWGPSRNIPSGPVGDECVRTAVCYEAGSRYRPSFSSCLSVSDIIKEKYGSLTSVWYERRFSVSCLITNRIFALIFRDSCPSLRQIANC